MKATDRDSAPNMDVTKLFLEVSFSLKSHTFCTPYYLEASKKKLNPNKYIYIVKCYITLFLLVCICRRDVDPADFVTLSNFNKEQCEEELCNGGTAT